jgi:uncharacterized protein YoxC
MWYTDAVNEITQYFVDTQYNATKENKTRVRIGIATDISKLPKESKELLAQAVTMVQDLAFKHEKIERKKGEGTNDKPSDTE